MAKFGYHVSHEQFKPSTLLKYVQMAQQAGFTHALSSILHNVNRKQQQFIEVFGEKVLSAFAPV